MRTFGKVLQWLAIAYGVLVIATAIIVAVMLAQPSEGANFAGVYLIVVTMPLSWLTLLLPIEGTPVLVALTATGLVQALLLWFIGRVVRNRG